MSDTRQRRGRAAEDAAAAHLDDLGLKVVERNVRLPLGEIDLVARDGAVWVFVEVKSRRADWGDPAAVAVTAAKRARLVRLARQYAKLRRLGEPRCRFDVVSIALDGERIAGIRHLRGAFAGEAW